MENNIEVINNEKNTNKHSKKIIISILLFLLILSIVLGTTFLIKKYSNDNKVINKNENNNQINIEDPLPNQDQETENNEDENTQQENPPNETLGENKEENKPSDQKENQNSQQKPNVNPPSKNEDKNNNQSNNNSTDSNNNNDNSSTPPPQEEPKQEEITIEPTIVTTNTINLNNYDNNIKITHSGTYNISGTLNHTIYIEANSEVTLNLNGVTIKSKKDAAIANLNENDLIINLKDGTTNTLSDGIVESENDGCLFSRGDITIEGTGTLKIYGNQIDGEGIATKNSAIIVDNGHISIYAVDDGLNTGGTGGHIQINNGNLYIESGGDGIDSNQDITFNGGTTFIVGGSTEINGGLDADGKIEINGGQVIALGSDQLQIPNTANQTTLCINLTRIIKRKTLVTILDENDNVIVSFEANDNFKNMIISTNTTARNFTIYLGGTNTGIKNNGIYSGGTYTKGTLIDIKGRTEFEIYDTITNY